MKLFAKTHEWIDTESGKVGISNHAQDQLGDIVYVDLPAVGKQVKRGEILVSVESVKAAGDVYAPVSGVVAEVNEKLSSNPEIINQSAENEGWIVRLEGFDQSELSELITEEQYKDFLEKGE